MEYPDDPSARVVRVPYPVMSPGQCGICGKNEHPEGFAAPNMDFEFYGTLYFCRDCTGDFARVFGFVAPEAIIDMGKELADQAAELAILREALAGLENTVDELITVNQSYRNRRNLHVSDSVSDVLVLQQGAQPSVEDTIGDASSGEVRQPAPLAEDHGTDASSDVEGRFDVHDTTTSADELLGLGS